MHGALVHLLPVLGAAKSKVPFYIAAGALAAWAVLVSVGFGLRRPDFPGDATGQRLVIAISVLLVVTTMSTAVVTAGGEARAGVTAQAPAQSTSSAGALALAADPTGQIRFDKSTLSAPAGRVTIAFANNSTIVHNVAVTTAAGAVLGATPVKIGSATLTVDLKPGSYVFVCQVHPTMKGNLTVT
jgi:plastocyanin